MQVKRYLLLFILFIAGISYGQNVLSLEPYNGTAATELIAQIKADTTANHGILPDRVYELVGGQIYICQEQFYVEAHQTLRLVSSNNEKALIYLYPTGTGSNPQNPPGHFVRLRGGNLYMTNIALSGIFELDPDAINNIQGAQLRVDNEGASIYLDNCVFSNTSGQVIRTEASTKTVKVTNSVFTNLGALTTSNFGAGKGIDLRVVSCDSLILVNNTFTNYQDRVVRHYNVGTPLAGTGNIGYTLIDHNTFYNGMGFHGLLSLGNVGEKVIITNNLFKDAFAAGEDSTDATRYGEWANTGEKYPNGGNRMMWIFTAPNDTTEWDISNNFYAISAEGQAYFNAHTSSPILEGSPLSWHINKRLGADSVKAFTKIPDPQLVKTQNLMTNLMEWYYSPTGGNKTKETGNFVLARDDMDRKPLAFWINDLDASYQTSSTAYTGAVNGYPAGDLNWFPTLKTKWEQGIIIGVDEEFIPTEFVLEQNYPNPFNPSTTIKFSVPKAGIYSLRVFNVLGQEVAKVLNGELNVGTHEATFNASALGSGVYFYNLTGNDVSITKKMMLIK